MRDFRGIHEIRRARGITEDQNGAEFQGYTRGQRACGVSHETSRVYECGCGRPEAPFGVTEDTKGRICRRHSSSRGSGSLRNRRHEIAVWEIQGFGGGSQDS